MEGVEDTERQSQRLESERVSPEVVQLLQQHVPGGTRALYEVGGEVEAPGVALGLTHKLFS